LLSFGFLSMCLLRLRAASRKVFLRSDVVTLE